MPIEILYTVAPFLIIAVLFYYTAVIQTDVDKLSKNPDVIVEVVAFKWNWQFDYSDAQGPGRHSRSPRSAPSDYIPVLVLPTDKTIRFEETSQGRHPLVLGAGACCSSGTSFPGNVENKFEITIEQRGRLRRPLRRAVRHVPLDDELRAAGGLAGAVPAVPGSREAAGQTTPEALAHARLHRTTATRRRPSRSTPTAAQAVRRAENRGHGDEDRVTLFFVASPLFLFAWPRSTAGGPTSPARAPAPASSGSASSRWSCPACCCTDVRQRCFWFVSRRIDLRPEDRPTPRSPTAPARSASSARAATGRSASPCRPRSPASAWCSTQWWLIAVGLIAVLVATCGLLFEYYTGTRRGAEH